MDPMNLGNRDGLNMNSGSRSGFSTHPGSGKQKGASGSGNTKTTRSGLAAIFKKELTRFFTDRRSVLTTILLPGLMIFVMYTFIGMGMSSLFMVDEGYVPRVEVLNLPSSLEPVFKAAGLELVPITIEQVASTKDAIAAKEADALIVFPSDFDERLSAVLGTLPSTGGTAAGSGTPLNIELYYNSTVTESTIAYGWCVAVLETYRDACFTLYSINGDAGAPGGPVYDLASEQDMAGLLLSALLPMLIIIFLFTGCMGVAPESIAGEKERGTIATLLVTPLKRHELALGKIFALSCIALLAAASSFIGIIASLPNLVMGASELVDVTLYGVREYLLLFAVIISTVMFFIGFISLLSAFAKTVKEATTLMTPLMIVVVVIAVAGSFAGAQDNIAFYFIPSFNSAQCIASIFSFSAQPLPIALTVVVNLVFTGICTFALTRMFNSERIIFAR